MFAVLGVAVGLFLLYCIISALFVLPPLERYLKEIGEWENYIKRER